MLTVLEQVGFSTVHPPHTWLCSACILKPEGYRFTTREGLMAHLQEVHEEAGLEVHPGGQIFRVTEVSEDDDFDLEIEFVTEEMLKELLIRPRSN